MRDEAPGPVHLLYLDDDPNDLALFALAADRIDPDLWVHTARAPADALNFLFASSHSSSQPSLSLPQLILFSWRLHNDQTPEFLRLYRTSPFSCIPIAAYSSERADEAPALASGVHAFFVKPLRFDDLVGLTLRIWHFARNFAASART